MNYLRTVALTLLVTGWLTASNPKELVGDWKGQLKSRGLGLPVDVIELSITEKEIRGKYQEVGPTQTMSGTIGGEFKKGELKLVLRGNTCWGEFIFKPVLNEVKNTLIFKDAIFIRYSPVKDEVWPEAEVSLSKQGD